jgi:hypothetical protein
VVHPQHQHQQRQRRQHWAAAVSSCQQGWQVLLQQLLLLERLPTKQLAAAVDAHCAWWCVGEKLQQQQQ